MEERCLYHDNIYTGELTISAHHRGLNFGDGLFETIKVSEAKPLFLNDHLERLRESCIKYALHYPGDEILQAGILRLLSLYPAEFSGRLKLLVFRMGAGNYMPTTEESEFMIRVAPYSSRSKQSVNALLIEEPLKMAGSFSMLKSISAQVYIYAAMKAKRSGAEEAIILNQWGRVCEGIHGNIFWKKNDHWYTPPITEGCIAGIMRKQILKSEAIIEQTCLPSELMEADEIYFSNVLRGKYQCAEIIR